MSVVLAAVLLVWNLTDAPIAVLLDGVVQCTVKSQRACRINDVPAGRHLVNTPEAGPDAAQRGKAGESPIQLKSRDTDKVCASDAWNKPAADACDRWLKGQQGAGPQATSVAQVPYKR